MACTHARIAVLALSGSVAERKDGLDAQTTLARPVCTLQDRRYTFANGRDT